MSHYDRLGLKWAKAVRWLLTAALLVGVYLETGLWTAMWALVLFVVVVWLTLEVTGE